MSHNQGGHEQKAVLQKGKQGIFRIIFGRTGVVAILLVAQFLFLCAIFQRLEHYIPYFWVANIILAIAIVEELMNKDENPTVKLTWAVLVMALPVFGLFLYLFTQKEAGHRIRNRQLAEIISESRRYVPDCSELMEHLKEEEPELYSLAWYLKENQNFPVFSNTRVKYFPLGEDKFAEMLVQLEAAKHFIFLEYFIVKEGYMWDRVLEILGKVHHEGYYVKMAAAWAVSVCYVKFPEKTEVFLRKNLLDDFTHNKAIQKIRESYRVSKEDKERLKELRRERVSYESGSK